jgi:hypothetical protein
MGSVRRLEPKGTLFLDAQRVKQIRRAGLVGDAGMNLRGDDDGALQ